MNVHRCGAGRNLPHAGFLPKIARYSSTWSVRTKYQRAGHPKGHFEGVHDRKTSTLIANTKSQGVCTSSTGHTA